MVEKAAFVRGIVAGRIEPLGSPPLRPRVRAFEMAQPTTNSPPMMPVWWRNADRASNKHWDKTAKAVSLSPAATQAHTVGDRAALSSHRARPYAASLVSSGRISLPAVERELVIQGAAVALRVEQLQAAILKGQAIDDDVLVRLSGESRRLLDAVRQRRVHAAKLPKAQPGGLADHLAALPLDPRSEGGCHE
jgi:hypothetical protein